jgi:hypothetical protein
MLKRPRSDESSDTATAVLTAMYVDNGAHSPTPASCMTIFRTRLIPSGVPEDNAHKRFWLDTISADETICKYETAAGTSNPGYFVNLGKEFEKETRSKTTLWVLTSDTLDSSPFPPVWTNCAYAITEEHKDVITIEYLCKRYDAASGTGQRLAVNICLHALAQGYKTLYLFPINEKLYQMYTQWGFKDDRVHETGMLYFDLDSLLLYESADTWVPLDTRRRAQAVKLPLFSSVLAEMATAEVASAKHAMRQLTTPFHSSDRK